ncbi:MAG: putative 4-hydroxy-4-methyl-2-oxoglutarate aldolase [Mariprofundaceae bacterium]|nr:putative 4-hydroxy-4-methyl-2-oxoglutarate aldolase [Mariprofundaceae bacterium]
MFKTSDLYDDYLEDLQVAAPVFCDFGGRCCFYDRIVTLEAAFESDGKGKVLVVDVMAALGAKHGWQGVIINGCIRDSANVAKVNIGIKALATIPRKTTKRNQGVMDIPLRFADVLFNPGEYVYADEDGIVISKTEISLSSQI